MLYTPEAPLTTKEIPEDEIIYIDDDSEDLAPIKQLTHHVDKVLMPPPVDTTLVSRETVPLPVNDQHNQRKRGLASRRKAKPLKLQVHQVARMRTGPVDHQRAQLMTQLTSAVVPLKKLQISETPQDIGVRILPTPQSEEFTPEVPKNAVKCEKAKQVEDSAKMDKTHKRTLFTVHTFKTTRKIKRRTLRVLKTSGYQNPG